jgi:hypothetical protein
MTAPTDLAATGLSDLAVRARIDAGQVNTVPPAPGRSLAAQAEGVMFRFTRNMLFGS